MEKKLLSTEEYYNIIMFLERELDEIAIETENLLIPAIGTPQHFPQATSQARVISQQSGLLQQEIKEAISILNTFAALASVNPVYEIHPLLNEQLDAKTQPFIKYYNENKNKQSELLKEWKVMEEFEKKEQQNGGKRK